MQLFKSLFVFSLLTLAILHSYSALADCDSQSEIPSAQCEVLVDIYNATDGANWENNTNWLDDFPCSWEGIDCANGAVFSIYLAGNNLVGSLPSLNSLENIVRLNFDFNEIVGSLPNLSGLTNLEGADFFANQISGELPEFINLPRLSYLNLGSNALEGGIPTSLFKLPLLNSFIINGNSGISSAITEDEISLSLSGFDYDEGAICTASQAVTDWLAGLGSSASEITPCFSVSAQIPDDILYQGDQLALLMQIGDIGLDESLLVDLYVSLTLPDETTAGYFISRNGVIDAEIADVNTWIPFSENYRIDSGSNTGLIPIFVYTMTGFEPTGEYSWHVRATLPNTEDIIFESQDEFYFNPAKQSISISAPDTSLISSSVSFVANVTGEISGNTYRWEFDDGTEAFGKNVSHSFSNPDRYRVTLNIENSSVDTTTREYHYINVGRPFSETIFPLAGTEFGPSTTDFEDIPWVDCDPNWNVYFGKYNSLFIEVSEDATVDRQHIINYLAFTDYIFESYSDIFGWDFIPTVPGLDTHLCTNIAGGGTGTDGSFYNYEDFLNPVEPILRADKYGAVVHESVHLWDFRGGTWLNSDDPAHAFTGGMEPIVAHLLNTGQGMTGWGGNPGLLTPLSGDYLLNHYFRVGTNRYLTESNLSWESYYTPPFSLIAYDDENIPENKEKMLVQGGLLIALYSMHGAEALKSIFLELERQALANSGWLADVGYADQTEEERSQNFMRVVADALQLDVSDYFSYWKWPYEALDSYMSRYPLSDKILDLDGDGFSPLEGDWDDADASVYPYAQEVIDGKDNNLDGLIDENVYTETTADISNLTISLPAGLYGEIGSLQDEDFYTFSLNSAADVTITVYSVRSDTTVPYSSDSVRDIATFAGTVYVNDSNYTEIVHDAQSAPESMGAVSLSAGTHTLRVTSATTDGRNSNPGEYEIQIFVNDHSVSTTADGYLDILYP